MTEQDHLTISRKLALAIGWKPEQMDVYDDELWIERLHNLRRRFDYRDWNVIGPIAERFDCFPYKNSSGNWVCSLTCGGHYEPSHFYSGNTPQLTIALAVIAAQGVK